jgi:nitrite reductase/ring-hydroxylating ferredoxin subunit/uncharacterized membrane protein
LALLAREPRTFGKETDEPYGGGIQNGGRNCHIVRNREHMEDTNLTSGTGSDLDSTRGSSTAQVRRPLDEELQKLLDKTLYGGGHPSAQKIRNFLNGTWLGEPLHVVLKDVPVGAWTVAMAFDALDLLSERREFARAADTSIAIGLIGAAGAAVTGMTDWSDVDPPARRLGFIHGLLNLSGAALFATSLFLRRRKSRATGRIVGALGYVVMSYASHLGGKLVYEHRVGVDRTDGQVFPEQFAAVLPETSLMDGQLTRAMYQGTPILLVRRGDRLFAMAETCSHFSGPLSEGKLEGDTVVCPYHFSRFALEDGRVLDGPAVHPQPCLETRTRNGQIEVRHAPLRAETSDTEE